MAPRRPFYSSFLLLLTLISAASSTKYFLPLVKDDNTTQFYTSFLIGTPPLRVNLLVDLSNQYSFIACDTVNYTHSSTYSVLPCDSPTCPSSSPCLSCSGPTSPSCNNNSCGAYSYTPWSNALYSTGLISDTISLHSKSSLPNFPFSCSDTGPLIGLSRHTKGLVTLARTPFSLNQHVSSSLNVPNKFAICPPSSAASGNGAVYFGGGPYLLPPIRSDFSHSLITTALLTNPKSTSPIYSEGEGSVEYFINVRSIKIDSTPLKFNTSLLSIGKDGNGGTKITTVDPYTSLHSQIYKPFVDLFVAKAEGMKLVKVGPVKPFGACFSAESIRYNVKTGRGLPIVDLGLNEKSALLHGKSARWRIYGSNSMVQVSKDVQCLGFVDGGKAMTSIAIGAKQLEDNLVEFDLEGSKIGFTSSLLRLGTSCSQFRGV